MGKTVTFSVGTKYERHSSSDLPNSNRQDSRK